MKKYLQFINEKNIYDVADLMLMITRNVEIYKIKDWINNMFFDINEQSRHGYTAISEAAFMNRVDLIELFINAGADPNIPSESGISPLMRACFNKSTVFTQSTAKDTHNAIIDLWKNKIETIRTLVNNGANINAVNEEGKGVLSFAAQYCMPSVVKEIIKLGANLYQLDKFECSIYDRANKDVKKWLQKTYDIRSFDIPKDKLKHERRFDL